MTHTVYHTSPDPITKISKFGASGECLCFSDKIYQMASCEVVTYKIELNEDEIIEASSFFYRDDCELLNDIVAEIMLLTDCDEDTAQEYLSQRDQYGEDYEIDLRIQGFTGEAAKALGYKAAEAEDEQGTVYLVPMFGRESELILAEGE